MPKGAGTLGIESRLVAGRKWPIGYDSIEFITVFTDIVTILLASVIAGSIYHLHAFGTFGELSKYVGSAAVVSALFVLCVRSRGMYSLSALLALRTQIIGICLVWGGVFLLLAGAVFALKIGDELSRGAHVLFATLGLVALIAHRVVWQAVLTRGLTSKRYSGRKIALITDDSHIGPESLSNVLTKLGFRIEHQFTLPPPSQDSWKRKELIRRVIASVRGSEVEEIMVSADPSQWFDLHDLAAGLRILPFPVSLIPAGPLSDVFGRRVRILGDKVSLELQRGPLGPFECATKRFLDIVLGAALIIVLSVPLLIVALAIKLDSPGPVLFSQRRCGFNGRYFQILKFRTMKVLEDGESIPQARLSDARVTRIGKWLRRFSIDELPQLLNVVAGSMSLVGPRPHAVAHDIEFDKAVRNYAFRHRVKPGVTGWAQVNGCRGSTPTPAAMEQRVSYDLWYIDNWSFMLDFTIMLRTAVEVVRGRNAY